MCLTSNSNGLALSVPHRAFLPVAAEIYSLSDLFPLLLLLLPSLIKLSLSLKNKSLQSWKIGNLVMQSGCDM